MVASKVLSEAAFLEGRYVQSYPQYGVERRGAPVVAFARIAEPGDEFFVRQDIKRPHHLVVLDPVLLETVNGLEGLRPGGWVLINTPKAPGELDIPTEFKLATVDASEIAIKYGLGSRAQPIVNTAILGAFARITGLVSLDKLLEAIENEVPVKVEENKAAATEAYEKVRVRDV